MKELQLSQGQVALVDDADFEWLNAYKWYAHRGKGKTFYALRNVKLEDGSRTTQRMHWLITGVKGTDHKDGNGLNNQCLNLRTANAQQQARNRATLRQFGLMPT